MHANPFAARLATAAAATQGTARRDRLDRVEIMEGPAFHFTGPAPVDMITERQAALVRTLLVERNFRSEQRPAWIARIQQMATVNGTISAMTKVQASAFIEYAFTMPVRKIAEAAPAVDVPEGRYAVDINGVLWFVQVDCPAEGRWAGHTFVRRQLGSDTQNLNRAQRVLVLKAIAEAGIKEATIRYGHELGHCGKCGRELTNEASRTAGIGPKCAAKSGW
jgi:hypothetical protein